MALKVKAVQTDLTHLSVVQDGQFLSLDVP